MPCENQATPLPTEQGPPGTWVCTYAPDPMWAFYRSPAGQYGIRYSVPEAAHVDGVFRNLDRPAFANWSDADSEGFVRLGDRVYGGVGSEPGDRFRLDLRRYDYEFTSNATEGTPSFDQLWSRYPDRDGDLWVLHRMRVDDRTYTFLAVREGFLGNNRSVFPFSMEGRDFHLKVDHAIYVEAEDALHGSTATGMREHCPSGSSPLLRTATEAGPDRVRASAGP